MMQHTKDKLADALRACGLDLMAQKAALGWYHDFLSPLAMPALQLLADLKIEYDKRGTNAQAIFDLSRRAMNGDFDASKEESDEWAAGPEGQAAFGQLLGKKP